MNKHQIAHILEEMADLLEISGENPFKVRAYQNAARSIDSLSEDLEELIQNNQLIEVKGIGKNIAAHVQDLLETDTFPEYEKLKKTIPAGLLECLKIPGMGAKKAKLLWKKLGVTSIEEVERACQEGKVESLQGFGKKSQEKIFQSIERSRKYEGRHLFPTVHEVAKHLLSDLRQISGVLRAELAGSLRRHTETVKDIDIVVSSASIPNVIKVFLQLPQIDQVTNKGTTKVSVILHRGINVDVRFVSEKEFPSAWHHFTGSKAHNVALCSRAKDRDMKISEYGIFHMKGKRAVPVPCKNEEVLYKKLGLDFIPPELREEMGEIEAAEKHELPVLIERADLKGCLHVHTTYSDGRGTLEEMALAAKACGLSYIGISDHRKAAHYAGGMQIADVRRQSAEIDELNAKLKGIRILKGIEVDILADGSLDYDDDVLASFEFVIASIHSRFSLSESEMTKRICTALAHPLVNILAHPTGRLLLSREPYQVNIPEVIACAAEYGKVIELNCNPRRFEIDWRWGPLMKEKGVKTVLSPDAHGPEQIANVDYGIGIGRKAWFEKKDVVNCLTVAQLLKHFS